MLPTPAPIPFFICWELKALPGPELDVFLSFVSLGGIQIEPISPSQSRYRLTGDKSILEGFAAYVEKTHEGWSLAIEQPPGLATEYSAKVAPSSPYRRTIYLHGMVEGARHLRMAIDASLQVTPVGIFRWAVTGRTAALMAWMAEAFGESVDAMLARWSLTPANVAAEDAAASVTVPVRITLPDTRTTTTAIVRNAAGDIVRVDSKTVDVG